MKKYIILLALLATGCTVTVNPALMAHAEVLCNDNDGVSKIDVGFVKYTTVCNNSAIFEGISKLQITMAQVKKNDQTK